MTIKAVFTAACIPLLFLMFSCSTLVPEVGSGHIIADSASFSGIDRFEFSNACEATIVQSDSSYVVINIDDNLMDEVDLDRDDDKLHVGMKVGAFQPTKFTARVYCPKLVEASASGASEVTVTEFDNADDFVAEISGASSFGGTYSCSAVSMSVSGASSVSASLTCGDISLDISGASSVDLTGTGEDLNMECSGASDAELQSFTVHNAVLDVSGASTVKINAEGTISGSLSGASDLYYYGSPTLGNIDECSSCDVEKK